MIKQEQPYRAAVIDSLLNRLKNEAEHLYTLATAVCGAQRRSGDYEELENLEFDIGADSSDHKAIPRSPSLLNAICFCSPNGRT